MNFHPRQLVLVLALSLLPFTAANAELKWEQTALEMHPAVGDKQAVGHFKYTNVGQTPIKIKSATSSCGCTVAKSQNDEVAPGQQGEITATFTIGERTGIQTKIITVQTDDPAHQITQLTLKTVIPDLLAITPPYLTWTTGEEPKAKTISIKAHKDYPAKDLKVMSSNQDFVVKVISGPAQGQWTLEIQPKETSRPLGTTLTIRPEISNGTPRTFYATASITTGPVPVSVPH